MRIMKNVSSILVLSLAGSLMSPFVSRAADDRVRQYPPKLFKFSAAKEQQVRMMATKAPDSVNFYNLLSRLQNTRAQSEDATHSPQR